MPAAPQGLVYHGSDKGFRPLGLSESTDVPTTVVFVFDRAFLRAISVPFVAPNACIRIVLFLSIIVFLRSEICGKHATFVYILSYLRHNVFQYF